MDVNEFESLARNIRPRMLLLAKRLLQEDEASDAVQETLMRLWIARERLGDISNPEGFAIQSCRNLCLDILRKNGRTPIDTTIELPRHPDVAPAADELIIERENEVSIDEIFNKLPPSQRVIIRLRHIEGLSTSEMAAITGTSEGAVRLSLSRARKSVAQIFKQNYNRK